MERAPPAPRPRYRKNRPFSGFQTERAAWYLFNSSDKNREEETVPKLYLLTHKFAAVVTGYTVSALAPLA